MSVFRMFAVIQIALLLLFALVIGTSPQPPHPMATAGVMLCVAGLLLVYHC